MMVTVTETCSSNFTLLNILLCFDRTIFQLVLQHNGSLLSNLNTPITTQKMHM